MKQSMGFNDFMIPHNRPLITSEDRHAVDLVLSSSWISQGPITATLEEKFVQLYLNYIAASIAGCNDSHVYSKTHFEV